MKYISEGDTHSSNPNKMIFFGIGLGVIFWIMDAFLDVYILKESSLLESIINPDIDEIWMRSFILFILFVFGVFAKNALVKQQNLEDKLKELSITDELTGLHNRRGFFTIGDHLLKMSKRDKRGIYMLYADIDNLKHINDTLGHREGDNVLIDFANILKGIYRDSDIITRLGGDEFSVIPVGFAGDSIDTIHNRLQNNLNAYNKSNKRKYKLSMSAGIVYYDPASPCSLDDLLAEADKKMYEQKKKKIS